MQPPINYGYPSQQLSQQQQPIYGQQHQSYQQQYQQGVNVGGNMAANLGGQYGYNNGYGYASDPYGQAYKY